MDPSPAVRTFAVDTVRPKTTILSGPTGITEDHSPSFTFSSNEPGSFECRLGTPGFKPCGSPFVPSSSLPDESYTFEVRARDAAGNADKTPASRAFSVETPLTYTPETAQAAAALYFPDSIDLDVPASCGGNPAIDCPGGTPLAPADQLRVTSTRSVVESVGQSRYDVTATSNVQTLQAIKFTVSGTDCDLTMTSGNGATPDWTVDIPLNFQQDVNTGELRIVLGDMTVNGIEAADWSLSGSNLLCSGLNPGPGAVVDVYREALAAHFGVVGAPMCAAPGPAYLGPCPAP